MTEKRVKATLKRQKKKAKEQAKAKKRPDYFPPDNDDLVTIYTGDDGMSSFLNIVAPSDARPLTDDLYNELVTEAQFSTMKKSDFDFMKKSGFMFNPTRRSFVQQPTFHGF